MPSGDSLSLATRFELQWVYRGRLALFWGGAFSAQAVRDEQRGFLRVDGTFESMACTVAVARFSLERHRHIPQTRFARAQMRVAHRSAVLFAHRPLRAGIFCDLGFDDVTPENETAERVYVRKMDVSRIRALTATI